MADTAAKTTTPRRPRATGTTPRKTAATKPAATKAAPAKTATKAAAPKEEVPAADATTPVDRFVVEFEYVADTKSYAKFAAPASLTGTLVGSIYAPLGTDRVKVAIFGVDAVDEEDGE